MMKTHVAVLEALCGPKESKKRGYCAPKHSFRIDYF